MTDDSPSQSQNFKEIILILDEMKDLGKFKGVLLAYRNGGLIAENISKGFDYNEFAAMCASVLESAGSIGQTIGDRKIRKIVGELDDQTIIINECDKKFFLVFLLGKKSKVEYILNKLSEYKQKLLKKMNCF